LNSPISHKLLFQNFLFFFFQKQVQIAVLPLGTGNDLARVLGWGASCDDDAHLPQLLDRYEKSSTKMLDRWSIMVFERGISLRRGTISHSPDAILSQFEDNAMWHLQVSFQFPLIMSASFVIYIRKHFNIEPLSHFSLPSFKSSQLSIRMIFKL
jgi:hypothetical protein